MSEKPKVLYLGFFKAGPSHAMVALAFAMLGYIFVDTLTEEPFSKRWLISLVGAVLGGLAGYAGSVAGKAFDQLGMDYDG